MDALLLEFDNNQPRNVNEWLWLDPELSDVTLTLSSANLSTGSSSGRSITIDAADALPSRRRRAKKDLASAATPSALQKEILPVGRSAAAAGTHVFQLHAIVLCSNSEYFRARITSAVGGSGSKRVRCEAMTTEVEADQFEAAASVLRFFYTSRLTCIGSSACSPDFLVQMLQVADCWQAPLALTAISTFLCKLKTDLFPISAVFTLTDHNTSPAFTDILDCAGERLMEKFGDATSVATCPTLLGSFLSLPHVGVLRLISSKELVTDAEATVLLLLSDWCKGKQGRACTKEQLKQLNGHILYSRLSTPFLTELFKILHTPSLSIDERMDLLFFRGLSAAAQRGRVQMHALNATNSWYLPPRGTPTLQLVTTTIVTLRVSESDLYQLLQATKDNTDPEMGAFEIASKSTFVQGFWWQVVLSGTSNGLWCGMIVHAVGSLMVEDEGLPLDHGVVCDCTIKICGKTPAEDVAHTHSKAHPVCTNGLGKQFGTQNSKQKDVLEKVWWQPYVVNGFVTIEATLSRISSSA